MGNNVNKKFYCIVVKKGEFVYQEIEVKSAAQITLSYETALISDTPFNEVGIEAMNEVSGKPYSKLSNKARWLHPLNVGSVCLITLDDPYIVDEVIFQGRKRFRRGTETFYMFSKGSSTIWVYHGVLLFKEIDGQAVENI